MKRTVTIGIILGILIMALTLVSFQRASREDNSRAYLQNQEEDVVITFRSGSEYRIASSILDLRQAVERAIGDNYWPDTLLTEEEFAERTGISENMYHNCLAEYQRAEAGIDMMILIQAREENVETIENYLNDYRNLLLKIYEDQPLNEAKIKASRIETIDQYVCYVQLGADMDTSSDTSELSEEKLIDYCQQENERALDIMERKILNKKSEAGR